MTDGSKVTFALPLMAHLVAGYPSEEGARTVAAALASGGASFLEIQFPFSDPQADGPILQEASAVALASGFTTARGFAFAREVAEETGLPVFVMCYANQVVARGVARFCRDAALARISGLIVPDLCPGEDEGLFALAAETGVDAVPVIAPGIRESRLARACSCAKPWLYAALRQGITGAETSLCASSLDLLAQARAHGAKVLGGFGIRKRSQLEALVGKADAAVIGSHFAAAVREAAPFGTEAIRAELLESMAALRRANEDMPVGATRDAAGARRPDGD